jgi:hypothetical protein
MSSSVSLNLSLGLKGDDEEVSMAVVALVAIVASIDRLSPSFSMRRYINNKASLLFSYLTTKRGPFFT